jgi:hypothetical protein
MVSVSNTPAISEAPQVGLTKAQRKIWQKKANNIRTRHGKGSVKYLRFVDSLKEQGLFEAANVPDYDVSADDKTKVTQPPSPKTAQKREKERVRKREQRGKARTADPNSAGSATPREYACIPLRSHGPSKRCPEIPREGACTFPQRLVTHLFTQLSVSGLLLPPAHHRPLPGPLPLSEVSKLQTSLGSRLSML